MVDRIDPRTAHELLRTNLDVLLLDVRSPEEYAQAHIAGAASLPLDVILLTQDQEDLGRAGLDDIASAKHLADASEASALIVYCTIGIRAAQAAQHLKDLGFQQVLNLGGIDSWPYELEGPIN